MFSVFCFPFHFLYFLFFFLILAPGCGLHVELWVLMLIIVIVLKFNSMKTNTYPNKLSLDLDCVALYTITLWLFDVVFVVVVVVWLQRYGWYNVSHVLLRLCKWDVCFKTEIEIRSALTLTEKKSTYQIYSTRRIFRMSNVRLRFRTVVEILWNPLGQWR